MPMSEMAEKVRSIGTSFKKGTKKTIPVRDERNGRIAGRHIEHWDDRVDAVATPPRLNVSLNVNEEGT